VEDGLVNIKKTAMCSSGAHYIDEDMIPDTFEKCVTCWEDTEYTRGTNIHFRNFYVEGAGQLCKKCYINIYG